MDKCVFCGEVPEIETRWSRFSYACIFRCGCKREDLGRMLFRVGTTFDVDRPVFTVEEF